MTRGVLERVKAGLGPALTARLRVIGRGLGVPRWGNLRRTEPFSSYFGFDRGTPIDRYYLHRFLGANRELITGEVLEIQMSSYTARYGTGVRVAHSVDIDPVHRPTYVCDLARSEGVVPTGRYDCVLLPGTLTLLRDIEGCLRQALRAVRPGGTLLASACCLVPLDPNAPDYWRHTAAGWAELCGRLWSGCDVRVESHGNCLAAAAAMLGLACEELTPAELDVADPRYPVLVTVRCRKPGAEGAS